jgi:hypothetical protein
MVTYGNFSMGKEDWGDKLGVLEGEGGGLDRFGEADEDSAGER